MPAIILFMLILTMAVGCASTSQPTPSLTPTHASTPPPELLWWYVRFPMSWPEEQIEPAWERDLLVAHRVVAPVLRQYRDDIDIWRFHRRAVRDGAGHLFSLLLYADETTARKIHSALQQNTLMSQLEQAGLLTSVYEEPKENASAIEATSDPKWSAELSRSWPYFIMGVSEMWLALIADFARQREIPENASLALLQAEYRAIDESIGAIYRDEGGHALLHHLSALFGYKPISFEARF